MSKCMQDKLGISFIMQLSYILKKKKKKWYAGTFLLPKVEKAQIYNQRFNNGL